MGAEENYLLKRVGEFLNSSRRQMQFQVESMTPVDQHVLWTMYSSANSPSFVDEDAVDLVTLYDHGDYAMPLPYKRCCEPNTVLTPEGDAAKLQSYTIPGVGSEFRFRKCDPQNDRTMLAELRGILQGTGLSPGMLSPRQRANAYIQGMYAKQERKTFETEVRQQGQFMLYGMARMSGPTIKQEDEIVDLKRDPRLMAQLPLDKSWCKPGVNPLNALYQMYNNIHDFTMNNARVTEVWWSPEAWEWFRTSDFFSKYECFCRGSGQVERRFSIDLTAPNPAPPGVTELSLRPGEFGERHYRLTEKQTQCESYVDENGVKKLRYVRKPILPPGSVFFVAGNGQHMPMSFYGGVEFLDENPPGPGQQISPDSLFKEGGRRFPNRYRSPDGKCWVFDMESRFFHPHKNPNATGILFPIPDKCPPPEDIACLVTTLECTDGKSISTIGEATLALGESETANDSAILQLTENVRQADLKAKAAEQKAGDIEKQLADAKKRADAAEKKAAEAEKKLKKG